MGILILFSFALLVIYLTGGWMLVHSMMHPKRKTFAVVLGRGALTCPEDKDLLAEEKTFTFPDGSTSLGWVIEGAVLDGPTFVMTHGWSNSRYGALYKAARLAQWGSRVVVYDMRAHGDQAAKVCTVGVLEPLDLLAVLDQVQQTPDEKFVLVGSSMGAGITLHAGVLDQQHHKRVMGVILDGPYRYALQPVAGHLRMKKIPTEPFCFLANLMLRLRLWSFSRYDRTIQAAQLNCPLLVLHGSDDPICPASSGKAIADAATDGRYVEIAGGVHGGLPLVDEQSYHAAIEEFLTRLPLKSA
ncbi:MAG: alpha/beta fold hydrolase [Phycisphaeraceae bacterium]|nr:alpha/beta fold hydrolase [Phycisphaeraceae bacterium]